MTLVVSDNFNTLGANVQLHGRTPDPTTAGNNWVVGTGTGGNMKGATGGGALNVGGDGGGNPDKALIDSGVTDMKATGTIITPGSGEITLVGRSATAAAADCYSVYVRGGTTIRDLRRRDAGSNTSLQSTSWAANPATNDIYDIEISGTGATVTIKTYRNGVQAGATFSDTNANRKTSGSFAGWLTVFGSMVWDDFKVDNLGAGGDATVNLTGVAGTGAVGTLGPVALKAITGVAGTGAVGNVAPVVSITLAGVTASGAVGTLRIDSSKTITGVVGTGAAGTVSALSGTVVTITGVAGTGAAGMLKISSSKTLTGVSATGQVGTVTVTVPASASVNLSGVSASGGVGEVSVVIHGVWVPADGGPSSPWTAVVGGEAVWTPAASGSNVWTKQ